MLRMRRTMFGVRSEKAHDCGHNKSWAEIENDNQASKFRRLVIVLVSRWGTTLFNGQCTLCPREEKKGSYRFDNDKNMDIIRVA